MRSGVLVVGSLNMDLVMRVERLPQPGETIKSDRFDVVAGGKGANQAVAAARLGADVTLVGAVGDDEYGTRLLDLLQADNVNVSHVRRVDGTLTGIAQIVVDAEGTNHIVIAPGANDEMTLEHVTAGVSHADKATVCLLQLEIPMEIVVAAAEMAHHAGMTVVLDPAPASPLPPGLLENVDVITPNETETFALTGIEVTDVASAAKAAQTLLDRGVRAAVIKMGERGALLLDGSETYYRPAMRVAAVDTTAAGDAFNGALGMALSKGVALPEAVDDAVAAGTLAVTRPGALPSLPFADEFMTFRAGQRRD